jgi:SNF2 family DNA or RNA helicase
MKYRTEPRPYQKVVVETTLGQKNHFLQLEQGLGKTKIVIDCMMAWIEAGLEGAIITSRSMVVDNWPEELAKHANFPCTIVQAQSGKMKKFETEMANSRGFTILLINDGMLRTDKGLSAATSFAEARKIALIVDESTLVKSESAEYSKRVAILAEMSEYLRLLSGEPAPQGAPDFYAQYKLVDPTLFGFRNKYQFEAIYCEMKTIFINGREKRAPNGKFLPGSQEMFEKNTAHCTTRIKKVDVLSELPEKTYIVRKFTLNPKARAIYKQLQTDYQAELEGSGEVTALLAVTRAIRLHQIACGIVRTDEGKTVPLDSGRMEVLMGLLSERPIEAKTIIWATFRSAIEQCVENIKKEYGADSVRVLYGGMTQSARQEAAKSFKEDPKVKFLVANPQTAGWGLTFTEADTAIYYCNSYNYEHRAQSEDRIHRIGQVANKVTYYDIVAEDTVEDVVMETLSRKASFSESVMLKLRELFKIKPSPE